jgi:hypothetical protein
MIRFKSKDIPGPHTSLTAAPPNLQVRSAEFFGVNGVSEIHGGQLDREVSCEIWLSKKEWTNPKGAELLNYLSGLDGLVGEFGVLQERYDQQWGGLPRKFKDCTFIGFFPLPLPGQQTPAPLQDLAFTLHQYSSTTNPAWFHYGRLVWRQLESSSSAG